jgi:catechol 2,3-dioxygenase-like lactoylglutathione lyase family enzyme
MDWKLEVVVVPVTDVDRAKRFYSEQLGFAIDLDMKISDEIRLVQLTPHGSACSIHLNTSPMLNVSPGSARGLHLVVSDLRAAHAQLVEREVDVSEVQVFDSGSFRPSRDGENLDNAGFVFFSDPDGNGWVLQQHVARG